MIDYVGSSLQSSLNKLLTQRIDQIEGILDTIL